MNLFTVGFTKKTAETFFCLLESHHINCLVDIRVHPGTQLSGFAKDRDLAYFLRRLLDCEYIHLPALAPTEEILTTYRKDRNWDQYVKRFEHLMDERHIPDALNLQLFQEKTTCLLCSEDTPDKCHRRLVAERLQKCWENVQIIHLH